MNIFKKPKCWQASLSLPVTEENLLPASSRFWQLQAFLGLQMCRSNPASCAITLLYSMCQISLCFSLIRTLVIGLRDHADNLEQSPHVKILKVKVKCQLLSRVCLFYSPPGYSVQGILQARKYWSGQPFPFSGDLPNPGLNPSLLHCRKILYSLSHQGSQLRSLN